MDQPMSSVRVTEKGHRRPWGCLVLCALFVFAVVWIVGGFRKQDRLAHEFQGFSELQRQALEMIMERAPGVRGEGKEAYIASFDAFHAYVARQRPDAVGIADSPNPFPGLLRGANYGRLQGQATSAQDDLFWGNRVRRTGGGPFRLTCGARLE